MSWFSSKKALGGAVKAVKCLPPDVDASTAQYRLSICASCPELRKDRTCRQCGCYMPVKVTCTREQTLQGVKTVRCPKGLWT